MWLCSARLHPFPHPFPLWQSEESLDDEAMMSVDEALGQVFRTRFAFKHQKLQQKGVYLGQGRGSKENGL